HKVRGDDLDPVHPGPMSLNPGYDGRQVSLHQAVTYAPRPVSYVETSGQQRSSDGAGFTRYRKRTRRDSADEKVRPPGSAQSQDPGEGTGQAARRRVTRSELRWSGEERRAGGQRQEELKLNSSTFALTGDSSHNQAMVHWSGQNSSVILMLTKLFDFNLNSVTESSLWRSTDYGATYQKLNDKVGVKTILSYLYVSPNNKRKVMSKVKVTVTSKNTVWAS
uniref:Sortilin N-terminal domain-containing protein n=1 Tax=Seriola lalandi dorsalis TaxID=1841481 RepID=A0A3B4Y8B6_SERLL